MKGKQVPKIVQQTNRKPVKRTGNVIDRISQIDFEGDDGIKLLLYGRSKTGKTTLWSSFPGPILCLISSGDNKAGELRSIDTPENRKKISFVSLNKTEEVRDLVKYQQDTGKYKTVVLDHATGFQDKVLAEILGLDELPAQKQWGTASQQQYGACTLQCKEHFRSLLGLDCNVVIVAQEREFNTDGDNSELLMPFVGAALTPSLVGWLNPACDYICNTFIRPKMEEKSVTIGGKVTNVKQRGKGVEFCLRVGPHEVYTTGFRIPMGRELPDVIVNPTHASLMKLIRG